MKQIEDRNQNFFSVLFHIRYKLISDFLADRVTPDKHFTLIFFGKIFIKDSQRISSSHIEYYMKTSQKRREMTCTTLFSMLLQSLTIQFSSEVCEVYVE